MTSPTSHYPLPNHTYRHYKGGLYKVICLATNEADKEPLVIYQSLENQLIWARPVASWLETVPVAVGIQPIPRFALELT